MQVQVLPRRYHMWMFCSTGIFWGNIDIYWHQKKGPRNAIWRVFWQAGFLDAMSLRCDSAVGHTDPLVGNEGIMDPYLRPQQTQYSNGTDIPISDQPPAAGGLIDDAPRLAKL